VILKTLSWLYSESLVGGHLPGACYTERDIMGKECIRWIEAVWK